MQKCAIFCFMSPQISKRWGSKIFFARRGAALDNTAWFSPQTMASLSSTLEIINTVTVIAFRLQFNQNMSIKTTAVPVTDVYI